MQVRRSDACCPGLCPDAPEEEAHRCDHCPLDRLDAAQCAEKGLLIRRALDLMSALKLAVQIGLDEIHGDECPRTIPSRIRPEAARRMKVHTTRLRIGHSERALKKPDPVLRRGAFA